MTTIRTKFPSDTNLLLLLETALERRLPILDPEHITAIKLFNGFIEGYRDVSAEIYGTTMLLHDYTKHTNCPSPMIAIICKFYLHHLPWINSVVLKIHHSPDIQHKRGTTIWGSNPDTKIYENGIWYALNLCVNNDTSFYLDTRNLRKWAKTNLNQSSVLNTFAYTGSLGVAARMGGARNVTHIDQSPTYLSLAKKSYQLNSLEYDMNEFRVGNFFTEIARLKSSSKLFDCVILDPPYFSESPSGRLDIQQDFIRLVNKVRPLVAHNGFLVTVNNALFLSGSDHMKSLTEMCLNGYLTIEEIIPVPEDCIGYPETTHQEFPQDPAPFNHSTKIAILRVKRKDQRASS